MRANKNEGKADQSIGIKIHLIIVAVYLSFEKTPLKGSQINLQKCVGIPFSWNVSIIFMTRQNLD